MSVTLAANAADNIGVIGVQFKLDGINVSPEDTTAPYAVLIDTTLIANGAHNLSAHARDAAGNVGVSSGITIIVNNSTEFAFVVPSGSVTSATTTAGSPVTFALNISPTSGFTGQVSLACSNLPPMSTCTVTPNPANVSGTAATPITITITTTVRSGTNVVHVAGNHRFRPFPSRGELPWMVLVLAAASCGGVRTRTRVRAAVIAAVCLLLVFAISCGGGGATTSMTTTATQSSGTPAGTYTVTMTGTSGGVTHSLPLTLTVN